jgi:hypothetical protein
VIYTYSCIDCSTKFRIPYSDTLLNLVPDSSTKSKKTRQCLIGNLIPYQTPSSFSTSRFFLYVNFCWKILLANFVKAIVNTAKYARNTLLFLICIYRGFRESAVFIRYRDSLCKKYSTRISIHALEFQDSAISFPVAQR